MKKPKIGQIIYSLPSGNAARRSKIELSPMIVSNVGRKYFKCRKLNGLIDVQFYLENWHEKTEYSSNYKLYEKIQDYEDEASSIKMVRKIKSQFHEYNDYSNMELSKLKRIIEIIEE